MNFITAAYAQDNLVELIKNITKRRKPVRITSKDGNAVLLSETDYEDLMETLELLSEPEFLKSVQQAKKEIKQGKVYSIDDILK